MKNKQTYTLQSNVLFVFGLVDLIRGFMHTVLLKWSATNIAMMDLSIKSDQLFLLGVFGISNILTGLIYILVSRRAKELSPYVLLIIPVAYLIGIFTFKLIGVVPQSAFYGRYFMITYIVVSTLVSLSFFLKKK